jgi:hypothetical protein
VKVTLLLADHAQAIAGKLYVMGAGWDLVGPEPAPMALAILIEVQWNETNRPHHVLVELQDVDGQRARIGPEGTEVWFQTDLEVGRPPGHPPGNPFNVPLAFNLAPMPLVPGTRYVWVASVGDQPEDHSRAAFNVRQGPPGGPRAV